MRTPISRPGNESAQDGWTTLDVVIALALCVIASGSLFFGAETVARRGQAIVDRALQSIGERNAWTEAQILSLSE